MIGSAELPAAFVALERTSTAMNSVVSAQLVDAVEALLAVRVRTLERSIFADVFRVQFDVDLILRQIDCESASRLFLDDRLSLFQADVAARKQVQV